MNEPIFGFYHIATMNHWRDIFVEQLAHLRESGLYAKTEKIFVSIVGNEWNKEFKLPEKFEVVYVHSDLKQYEFPMLDWLLKFSRAHDPIKVWYMHTKGVSQTWDMGYGRRPCLDSWRRYMQYFLMYRNDDCILNLDKGFDTCGTELLFKEGKGHYSGNFWWANSLYIKRFNPVSREGRNCAEQWLGTGQPKWFNYFNSLRDLYAEEIAPAEYMPGLMPSEGFYQEKIRAAGSDSLQVFGGSWQGGYFIQQCPGEFAKLLSLLREHEPFDSTLDIGIASGGATRLIRECIRIFRTAVIDDGKHSGFPLWEANKKGIANLTEFVGDSHSPEAEVFLRKRCTFFNFDLVFIDGDHSYEGVRRDWLTIRPLVKRGALVVFHDIRHCADVNKLWEELKRSYRVLLEAMNPAELGIGVLQI